MAGTGRKTWVADEVLTASDLQSYLQDQVVFVYTDATARASGILSPTEGMVSYLKSTDALEMFNGSSWVNVLPDVGTPGTYTKVVTDSKGRVTSATTLSASDIPSLDASKVSTGAFDINAQTSGTLPMSRGGTGGTSFTGYLKGAGGTFTASNDIPAGALTGNINLPYNGITMYNGTFTDGIYSAGVYNRNNTGRAVYISSDGTFGVGGSSEAFKENIVDAKLSVDAIRKIRIRNYTYKPDFSDDATVQVGVIAEELVNLGLSEFVYTDEEGAPNGVAYDKLALAALALLQVESARVDSLEARVKKLESK